MPYLLPRLYPGCAALSKWQDSWGEGLPKCQLQTDWGIRLVSILERLLIQPKVGLASIMEKHLIADHSAALT